MNKETIVINKNAKDMTREEKDLVLHDLCARLPHGVKCQFEDTIRLIDGERSPFYDRVLSAHDLEIFMRHNNFHIKPYLRPMSSMTEEERKEYNSFFEEYAPDDRWPHITKNFVEEELVSELIDWLNKKMFDFRGLIPRGCALSTEVFNPY